MHRGFLALLDLENAARSGAIEFVLQIFPCVVVLASLPHILQAGCCQSLQHLVAFNVFRFGEIWNLRY